MSRGFSSLDNPSHQGATNTWLTPLEIVNSLGRFDLDPCGYPGHETAKRLICLPDDGLTEKWSGRVWLNPPYGRHIYKWLKKLEDHGNGIALVFSRTDTKWFQEINPTMRFYLSGRIKFLRPDFTQDTNAGHGSVLLAFGSNNAAAITKSKLKGIY